LKFNNDCFENPNSIGSCVFLSYFNNELVGFASYDPRNIPEFGIVGQNCILPQYRGRGFGKLQIAEILRIFKEKGARKVKVTTGQVSFHIPSQKMYESLGFIEVARGAGDDGYLTIDYEVQLM